LNFTNLQRTAETQLVDVLGWLQSPQFYVQVAAIAGAIFAGLLIARQVVARVPLFTATPEQGPLLRVKRLVSACRDLVRPLMIVAGLALATAVLEAVGQPAWLVRIAQSAALIYVLYAAINRFITHPVVNLAARWVALPLAALLALGLLDEFAAWLDTVAFTAGNIRISVLALAKAAIFGGLLFWLGRFSTTAGQRAIRDQDALDIQTRELAAKALEIAIYVIVALLLFNILGLDLTTLAVLGGAIGVGLGFGLQQIASNFISGIIILLERSLKIGDYIEMEDGKGGTLREINMRSSVLDTGDGREIMLPNEKFITTRFTNWTKTDRLQEYNVTFHVPYDCDLRKVPVVVLKALAAHPDVLKAPHAPKCLLQDFAGHGVKFQASYWIENKGEEMVSYGSDIRFRIWEALKAAKIEMPVAKEIITS
jgi:small-conductance mechanosensitive channel